VRIGVVGVGALSLRAVIPHLAAPDHQDQVVLSALCDPVLDRAAAAAEQYGVPRAVASLDEMLATDIDLVTVVSPIGLHHAHVKAALEAGKHVHVNKTMTTTRAEADELIELSERTGRHIVASPGEVLRPQVSRARELIAAGAIGTVAWAICGCSFETYHEEEPERAAAAGGAIDPSWYYRRPGGGPMYDMTVYALHQLTSVLGPAKRVTALSGRRIADRSFLGRAVDIEVDDNTVLLLDFGDGLFAVAHGTAAGWTTEEFGAATYFGTEGTLEGILLNGELIDFPGRELTEHAPRTDWEAQMRVLPHVTGTHRTIPESHVYEDVMQLVRWVRTGRPSPANARHARHVIEIIESGYRAGETGRTQDLVTDFPWPPTDPVAPDATPAT
jgi:predicted dehydrogenase